ncbi:MAG: N-acetylmuramoyl-L-alanine amidase [Chloroflexi bacterium]|nr:N-acetylmuramoyl-L-alanine amidase [Chloroflexota bacterium]
MTIFTQSIWDAVRPHAWKYRTRTEPVTGLIWHSTRGGQGYDGRKELQAALNWFRSPNNRIVQAPFEPFAGISHVTIGPDAIVEVVPIDDFIPAWSSHPSDEHAISIEVAQSNSGQAIEPGTIANCRKFAAWAAAEYRFPLGRLAPAGDDWKWSGELGHEDTVQGKAQGKTDPGLAFWNPYLQLEDEMTKDEIRALIREELRALHIIDSAANPSVSGATLDGLDDFVTRAFTRLQGADVTSVAAIKKVLHPDKPQI